MSTKEKVLEAIDSKREEIIEFIRSLMQTAPVNPAFNAAHDEYACQMIIKERLDALGKLKVDAFDVRLEDLEEYRGQPGYTPGSTDMLRWENRPNLLARLPGKAPEKGKSLILTGHSDVVAVNDPDKWSHPPYEGVIDNGIMFGRGSVDMLSGLGCMVMAIEAIVESQVQLNGDLWLGSSVGEEFGGTGFLAISDRIKKQQIKIDAGIMGEPTDLDLSLLCRGVHWGEIIVTGRRGHIEVTQPHWTEGGAVDAIQKARYIMNAIDELNRDWLLRPDKNHPLLTETCEVKIAQIEAGHHTSSYADYCKLSFNVNFFPHESDGNGLGKKTRDEIEAYIKRFAESDPWLREHPPVVKWVLEADCSEELTEDDPFVQVFRKAAEAFKPDIRNLGCGFHTDTGWLARLGGIKMVNFGPGSPMLAHMTDEQCKVEDIITATKAIAMACMDWCEY